MFSENRATLSNSQGLESSGTTHLSELWAQRYLQSLATEPEPRSTRQAVAEHLMNELRSASAKAWNLTESLLSNEVKRHRINAKLIDPWAVSKDVHDVFEKALTAYGQDVSPQALSRQISHQLGQIRASYTAVDPRLIGFVSMQFHYCGRMLADCASPAEHEVLTAYFKVIDDHLYMPLQRAYDAAARYAYNDGRLHVIQALLPHSTTIANRVVDHVYKLYPNYRSYTDRLVSPIVRISSVRDTEMFQIYLWTCVLEQSPASIQQELFPLCVMLYPTLRVNWELVRQMLSALSREFKQHIQAEYMQYYLPYQDALWSMFSPNVFPDVL